MEWLEQLALRDGADANSGIGDLEPQGHLAIGHT